LHGTCVRGLIEGAHRRYNLSDSSFRLFPGRAVSGLAAALHGRLARTADPAAANPPSCTGE